MANSVIGKWIGKFLGAWLGGVGVEPPPSAQGPDPSSGQRRRRGGGYGYVEYPKKKVAQKTAEKVQVFSVGIQDVAQPRAAFHAELEIYKVPVARGVLWERRIKASVHQLASSFSARLRLVVSLGLEVYQEPQRFRATMFQIPRGEKKMPKWIQDVIDREEQERDDEEAILALLFGRKL